VVLLAILPEVEVIASAFLPSLERVPLFRQPEVSQPQPICIQIEIQLFRYIMAAKALIVVPRALKAYRIQRHLARTCRRV
jgi:hypothetical protein